MKIAKLIILSVCFILVATRSYAQDFQQYVHLLTKAEAASTGVQLGCTCYRNVQWKQASATMTGLPLAERGRAQPVAKPTQTEVYDLYESIFGNLVHKERHTVVVIDLSISIKEDNLTNVMAKRKITFVGEMLNAGGASLYNIAYNVNTTTNIVKEWILNSKTPVPPYAVSKTDEYKIMDNALRVEKQILTKNDNTNSNQVDTWVFTYSVTLKGRNCTKTTEKTIISQPKYINVYKLLVTRFRDKASRKDWKVVIGQDIEQEAKASPDCVNFNWEMPAKLLGLTGNDNLWHLKQGSDVSNLKIPFSDLSEGFGTTRVRNIHFGDTYSNLQVTCKDNFGVGNMHTASKSGVKIYFPRDVDLDGNSVVPVSSLPLNQHEPLWFIFWKEGNVVSLLRDVTYKNDVPRRYGVTISGQVSVYPESVRRTTYKIEGLNEIVTNSPINAGSNGTHAQALIGTITHENYHKIIFQTWGDGGIRTVIDGDGDAIPNLEELTPGSLPYPGSSIFPMSEGLDPDTYSLRTRISEDYEDYGDQELRCRILQYNITLSGWRAYYFSDKDWSNNLNNPNW